MRFGIRANRMTQCSPVGWASTGRLCIAGMPSAERQASPAAGFTICGTPLVSTRPEAVCRWSGYRS
jgi:hypothetical protein